MCLAVIVLLIVALFGMTVYLIIATSQLNAQLTALPGKSFLSNFKSYQSDAWYTTLGAPVSVAD